ncbi:MAG: cation diffusion facilitator family transporter [Planctomycetota bacterium]
MGADHQRDPAERPHEDVPTGAPTAPAASGAVDDASDRRRAQAVAIRRRAAGLSLAVGVVVLLIKAAAYLLTGSSAIFSDFLESIVHVFATTLVWYAMRLALQPPDREHPYGHGKAEYLSVGFEGALIFMAGAGIIWHTIERVLSEATVQRLGLGVGLIAAVALINLVLGLWLRHVGRRTDSPLLIGDAAHVLSDVWTTAGVCLGIGLVHITGLLWLDHVIALLVALWLMWTALRLLRDAFQGLMDQNDTGMAERIVAILNRLREPQWADVHNLRVRRTGDRMYVDFHLTVPGEWSVQHGHRVMDRIESAIMEELDMRGAVLIHLDCSTGQEPIVERFTLAQAQRMKQGRFEAG